MLSQLKRQYHNIFKIDAVSFLPWLHNALMFPLRFKFNLDTRPVNIFWSVTHRCNLNCKYCFYAKNRSHLLKEKELSTQEAKDFIKKSAKFRPAFYLTGGEPLVRTDLEEIIREIRQHKMKVGLNTNATLLTKDRLQSLNDAGLNYMILSLDTNEKDTDSVRGDGVYQKSLEMIKTAKKMKLKTKIVVNCVVSESNYHELDNFLDLMGSIGVDALKMSYLFFYPKKEIDLHKQECLDRLGVVATPDYYEKELPGSGEAIAEKVATLQKKIKKMKIPVSFNPNLNKDEIINWFNDSKPLKRRCLYLFNVLRITPGGNVYPCGYINNSVGNILEKDILKIYNSDFYKKLRKEIKKSLFHGCTRCDKL